MKPSRIHILIMPQGAGKTRRFSLPGPLGAVILTILFFVTVAGAGLFFDYCSLKEVKQHLVESENKSREQADQLMHMAGEIGVLAQQLAESQGLAGHDQKISLLQETVDRISSYEGKQKQPATTHSALLPSEPYESMIRRMHESLDYLHAELSAAALLRESEGFDFAFAADETSAQTIDAVKAAGFYKRTMIKSRLRTVARELGLAPRLALSMAQVESGFNPSAVSPRGAIGVLQIMPSLASEHFEVDPEMLFDPEINIRIGLLHMKYLLDRFENNIDLSLAAYNAGVRRVITAGYKVPPITETREYVRKVKAAMNDYVFVASWEN
jgi:soluble lytic murein transglycosylase-like protein